MYEKAPAFRLVAYSVAGVICGILMVLGIIDQDQTNALLGAISAGIGVLVSVLAGMHVNKVPVDPAPSATPADPIAAVVSEAEKVIEATVGAFQKRE